MQTVTRKGKIARLPGALREQLNRRLSDGESGRDLIAWLNALPEVQALLARKFGGRPINDQNFTEWRQGGYREWLALQKAQALAEQLGRRAMAGGPQTNPPTTDALGWWVAARYAVGRHHVTKAKGARQWRLLREMCRDVVALRRSDLLTQRLDLEREKTRVNSK